jgi:hypothetical protein
MMKAGMALTTRNVIYCAVTIWALSASEEDVLDAEASSDVDVEVESVVDVVLSPVAVTVAVPVLALEAASLDPTDEAGNDSPELEVEDVALDEAMPERETDEPSGEISSSPSMSFNGPTLSSAFCSIELSLLAGSVMAMVTFMPGVNLVMSSCSSTSAQLTGVPLR